MHRIARHRAACLTLLMCLIAGSPLAAEPVTSATPDQIDGRQFDLVVIGGTPGAVACAVRAAREGLEVLLVNHTHHLGGMMTNGLLQWDALYDGRRAPIFSEVIDGIEEHYRTTYGEDSPQFAATRFSMDHYPTGMVEPKVAERLFNELVADESRITLLQGWYPTAVMSQGPRLTTLRLEPMDGDERITVNATVFADASYEADLAALAKVPYRVGREARDEYDEPHAGKVFTNIAKGPAPTDAVEGRLNIRPYNSRQGSIDPDSPFTADGAVQAFNYRFCVTSEPDNRVLLTEPPANYNREEYVNYNRKTIAAYGGPNGKATMNSPILPGENHEYPEADWPTRDKITQRHLDFALGLMYFLQNDESISEAKRREFREWGLPRDEYTDHGHIPYEMYVRETRRIVGRHVYTEHDNSFSPDYARTPVHADSVAITDWYMDSHSCTTESRPGYHYDGKLILTEESRPGQIPYRALLPRGVDNLLVPVCLSATHIAWGAVRLEPVWMQTGEAAGYAAALAVKNRQTPAEVSPELLSRTLAEGGFALSFFNDVRPEDPQPWVPAVEYFGTKGMFPTYNARPNEPLGADTAKLWADGLADLNAGRLNAGALAKSLMAIDERPGSPVTADQFAGLLPEGAAKQLQSFQIKPDANISRGDACRLMFALTTANDE